MAPVTRALVVGAGSAGRRHLRVVPRVFPEASLAVLRHRACVEVPDEVWCTTSMAEAVAWGPDVAVIAGPASHHVATAVPLIEAGVPLLIEKPLATTADEVAIVRAAATRHRVPVMVGYNLRFVPSLQQFKALLEAGVMGRVLSVRAEVGQYLPDWRPGTDYRQGVTAQAALGGGALLELSHEIDYLQWIFGRARWVTASLVHTGALEMDAEDTAHLHLALPQGTAHTFVATLSMDVVRRDAVRTCVVIGERGSVRWDGRTGRVSLCAADGVWRDEPASAVTDRDASYEAEWRYLASALADGTLPDPGVDAGDAVARVVDAARRSSVTGQRVPIEAWS